MVFIEQWVNRQAAVKLASRSGINLSLDQVIAEVWTYMQEFASFLIVRGLSKVYYEPNSLLFASREDEIGMFFDMTHPTLGEIRRLALDVSPIAREGQVFSFHHKSILEFLVGKQVR